MHSHKISLDKESKSIFPVFVNPEKRQSFSLLSLLGPSSLDGPICPDTNDRTKDHDVYMKTLKIKLSKEGENPNQRQWFQRDKHNGFYTDPMSEAVLSHHKSVLELLLNFGGHPFLYGAVAFKLALSFNYVDKLNLMIAAFSKPVKPLSSAKLHILKNESVREGKNIVTHFHYKDGRSIDTCLKKTSDLKLSEKNVLFKIFSDFYQGNNLQTTLENDLKGDNKVIDLIIDKQQNRIVGFNLFEILEDFPAKGIFTFHWLHALLDSSCRQTGIMSLLAYRLAFCLQLIFPNNPIIVTLGNITADGYRLVKDFLHFPKHQPQHITQLMLRIFSKIYEGSTYHHSDITFYTEEEIYVKRISANESSNDLVLQFYYRHIIGTDTFSPVNNRVGLVLLFLTNHMFLKVEQGMAKVGINFREHIAQYAELFRQIYYPQQSTRKNQPMQFFSNDQLFWSRDSLAALANQATKCGTARRSRL